MDDDGSIRGLCRKFLEIAGFSVQEADNGHAALELARKEKPDLILLDVMIPGMDGMETLQEIRADADLVTVPVVMLTARSDRKIVEKALLFGANDFIVKPPERNFLISV